MKKDQIAKIEANLRDLSIDLWKLTVNDPETATDESEARESDPLRLEIRSIHQRLKIIVDQLEEAILKWPQDNQDKLSEIREKFLNHKNIYD